MSDGFRASVAAAAAALGPDAPPFRPGYDEPDAVERAWKAQEQLYDELDDIYVEQAAKDMGLDDQEVSAAGLETSAAQSELVYEDAYGNDIIRIWAAEEKRRQTVNTDHYKLMILIPRLPRDEKGYFVAPVETSAGPGPALHEPPPVHDIVLPPESADSAAVRSTSTFTTQSNLLRTHFTAPGYDASRPRPAPRALLPPTPLPPQPQPHVDRLVLREQIRRERAFQPTIVPPRPHPRSARPRLHVQTRFQQHEPAQPATLDDPSSGEYTSDEDFVPRAARRSIKEQRLLSKSERLKESETPPSPPATAERASLGTTQGLSSEVRSGFQRRGPANPIRITSAKTGKEVDLARQRAESPTPTRARAGRAVYVSASEVAVKNLTAACPTARHVHAARELLLEDGGRDLDALGEEH
ncbi:hypothetical protein LTR42_011567 [Elasticomyces elasticus]|nr:hypothetical protein LTR42_011567 [Elasticomyces elasticus]